MWFVSRKIGRATKQRSAAYVVTYRMQTGTGRLEVKSQAQAAELVRELRLAGASDIVVFDSEERQTTIDARSK